MSADDAEAALAKLCSREALAEMLVDTVSRVGEARALFCDDDGNVDGVPGMGTGSAIELRFDDLVLRGQARSSVRT